MSITLGTAELVGHFEDGSPEWHDARQQFIGASDVPIILGLSSYKSPFTLWHEKAGLLEPAPVTVEQQRKRDYGHYMEPFVANLFLGDHPDHRVLPAGTWRHRERIWQGCNPDRFVESETGQPTVLQIKTANYSTDWDLEIPPGYYAQVLWELDTFGWPFGYLGVYFNVGGGYRDYRIDADEWTADSIRQRVRAFSDSITDGEPPDIDGSPDTYATLRRLNPSLDRGKAVTIPRDIANYYRAATITAKESESELFKWKGHLLAHMGTAQYAKDPDGVLIASRVAKKDSVPYLKEA